MADRAQEIRDKLTEAGKAVYNVAHNWLGDYIFRGLVEAGINVAKAYGRLEVGLFPIKVPANASDVKRHPKSGNPEPRATITAIPVDKANPNFDPLKDKVEGYFGAVKGWEVGMLVDGAEALLARLIHKAREPKAKGKPDLDSQLEAREFKTRNPVPDQVKTALDTLIREAAKQNPPTMRKLKILADAETQFEFRISAREDNANAFETVKRFCTMFAVTLRDQDTGETLVQGDYQPPSLADQLRESLEAQDAEPEIEPAEAEG